MKIKYTYCFFLTLVILFQGTIGITQVVIPDPNFRQFLVTNFPTAMNPDQTLNPATAPGITGPFKCYNQNISNLSGIEYFTGITTLEVKYNPGLTSLPNISTLTNITILGVDSNGLTSLPNLSSLVNLQILSFHHNQVTTVPSLAGLNQITSLLVQNNELTTLPDLSSQVNLLEIYCSDNPLTSLPSFSALANLDKFLCQRTKLASMPDMNNCPLLQYYICTNNKVTALPPMNNCTLLKELKVFNCQLTALPDISIYPGLYSVKVQNNFLSFEDLIPLTLSPFYNTTDFTLVPQQELGTTKHLSFPELSEENINLNIDTSLNSNTYTWYKNSNLYLTTKESKLNFNSIKSFDAGTYYCIITNSGALLSGMTLKSASVTLTTTASSDDPVFYPNGDGIADTYFIKETGLANIYNREGVLIKKLTIPANWDGTNTSGQDAPSGLYVIEINSSSSVRITLLR
jgi:internalin A